MRRLIIGDLLENARVWLGVLIVTIGAALVGAVVASDIETGLAAGGLIALALYSISGTIIVFSAVAALVVLGSVTALAVTLHQRAYALWQLIGLRPASIRLVVHAQLAIVAVVGGVAGCLLAVPVLTPLYRFSFAGGNPEFNTLTVRFGLVSAAGVVLFILLLVTAASARGARRASRTPVIQSLREAQVPSVSMTLKRWIGGALVLALLVAIVSSLPGTAPDQLSVPLMVVGPLLAGLFTAAGPLFLSRLVRAWTSLVPASWSSAWYLARNRTESHISRSATVINPLVVAVALAGGLYAAGGLSGDAGGNSGTLPPGGVVLLLGGPLMLSLLGATVSIFMSSRSREREVALVVATGATWGTAIRAAVAEALIYVGTAGLLGAVAVLVTRAVGVWASGAGLSAMTSSSAATAVVLLVAGGALLMVPATVIPTVLALRRDVPRLLTAE